MATTQVAMVEELASLVKDNLHSKHLVLSTEEALVAVLRQHCRLDDDDEDAEGTIELQPVGAYHRLLLHRLAEIYGFAHESVGEGEDRHLVLQRCSETAIPPVLVSDMLWKYDNCADSTPGVLMENNTDCQDYLKAQVVRGGISVESSHQKGDEGLQSLKQAVTLPAASLKERKAAYRAARERIFSTDNAEEKDTSLTKSRQVPVVAQRMIAHALGKKVHDLTETVASTEGKGKQLMNGPHIPTIDRNNFYPVSPDNRKANCSRNGNSNADARNSSQTSSSHQRYTADNRRVISAESLKKEQTGAAKRMFALALGLPAVQGSNGTASKPK